VWLASKTKKLPFRRRQVHNFHYLSGLKDSLMLHKGSVLAALIIFFAFFVSSRTEKNSDPAPGIKWSHASDPNGKDINVLAVNGSIFLAGANSGILVSCTGVFIGKLF
jgi:hypothetical protein